MKKIVFSIMVISVISKIFGFGRELFFSYYFGASYVTDAYLVSTTIPLVIFSLVGVGINSAFIPIFTNISENESKERAFTFTSRLLLSLFIICTLSYFIILVFTSPIVKIFASGFSGDILKLTVEYTRISALIIYFVIVINTFTALLQVNNKFYIAAIIGIPFNVAYMIGIYIAYLKGNTYLPIVTVITYLVQALMLFYPVKKLGYKFKYNLGLKDKYLKQILIIALPAIIGGSLEQVNYLIDKTVASRIGIKGGITLLNYSSKLNLAISGILISSLLVVFFPRISKLVAKNDRITLKNEILNTISFTMIVSIPISILILILRYEINSVIGVILNIFLNLTLSKYLGLPGIALATTISIIFTVILLFFTLYKKYKVLYIKEIIVTFLKIILASIIVGFIVYNIKNILINYPLILNLMFSSLVGIIIYILIIIFMRIKIVDDFVKQIKRNVIRRF